jgi:Stress responsive A/B Barrel Domain
MSAGRPVSKAPYFAHVCLFQLRREVTDEEWLALRDYESGFLRSETCLHYRFSRNISRKAAGFDLVLFSIFASKAAKECYVSAPLHDELAAFMDRFVASAVVADSLESLSLPTHPKDPA